MIVLIDNGHGANTPGKCSPDKQIREYSYAREIASLLEQKLKEKGITAIRIVTEENDVPLSTRVQRVNTICREFGSNNCCIVSIHLDAAGSDNKWHDARGFSVRVAFILMLLAVIINGMMQEVLVLELLRMQVKKAKSLQDSYMSKLKHST